MSSQWELNGAYFESCNCDAACPCIFLGPPTRGDCTLLVAWHIDQGHFGDIRLNGLNTVLAVHSPGHMLQTKWKAALYVDDRATQEQRDSLTKIFAGQAGGHLASVAACVGEVLGVKAVPIDYRAEGKRRSISIKGMADLEIEAVPGQNDAVGAAALLVDAVRIVFVLAVGVALPVVPMKGTRHSDGQDGQREYGGRSHDRLAR